MNGGGNGRNNPGGLGNNGLNFQQPFGTQQHIQPCQSGYRPAWRTPETQVAWLR